MMVLTVSGLFPFACLTLSDNRSRTLPNYQTQSLFESSNVNFYNLLRNLLVLTPKS